MLNDPARILKVSAELGHYVGDAHAPHTTRNYNGQLTGQTGIHGLWESRLPELFSITMTFMSDPLPYVDNPTDMIWKVIEESHLAVDSVLRRERELAAVQLTRFSYETKENKPSGFMIWRFPASTMNTYRAWWNAESGRV